jgi:glycosyltransferase involved in cell wall biosynthesis
MIHICLNMVGDSNWMGGVIYTQNLVKALSSLPAETRNTFKLSIIASPKTHDFVKPLEQQVDNIYLSKGYLLKIGKELSNRLSYLPTRAFNFLDLDFVYPTSAGTRSPYPWGAWIPDFQHRHMPEYFSEDEIRRRENRHALFARESPVIVLSSQMAKDEFDKLYPKAKNRSRLMSFPSFPETDWFQNNPIEIQKKYQLPDRFFLVSNQFWPHKNHSLILEALNILKNRNIFPSIVFTGKIPNPGKDSHYLTFEETAEKYGIRENCFILGLIPRIHQIQLMRRSLAVLQPSLFEGWSTVIEDARALGKPILASDFPVHLEQNPPSTFFFDRSSPEELAELLSQAYLGLVPGPNLQQEQKAQIDNQARITAYGKSFIDIARFAQQH